jgi:uncharacterized protein
LILRHPDNALKLTPNPERSRNTVTRVSDQSGGDRLVSGMPGPRNRLLQPLLVRQAKGMGFLFPSNYDKLFPMTLLSNNQVFEILGRLEPEIRTLGVARLAVFGSVVRGQAQPESDVDLLVQFRPGEKSYERFVSLWDLLECHLGRKVDLVTTEALSPFLGSHILTEAEDVLRAV